MGDFTIEGLEEFQEKLKTVQKKAPDRIIKELNRQGNKLRRATRENTPADTGKLRKGYRLKEVEKVGKGYQKGMHSKSPLFHLIERGHFRVTKDGKREWVNGVFMVEKTVSQQEPIIMGELKIWLDKMFEELK